MCCLGGRSYPAEEGGHGWRLCWGLILGRSGGGGGVLEEGRARIEALFL